MYASRIKRDSTINLDKNGSTLSSETSFEGAGHIDTVKKECGLAKAVPTYESHEDYLGSFDVHTYVDEYRKERCLEPLCLRYRNGCFRQANQKEPEKL